MNEYIDILITTLVLCVNSTLIAGIFGIPLGLYVGQSRSSLARRLKPLISALAGIPPVVAGLMVFLLLSNAGPLASLRLLYTSTAIVIAQVLIVTPLIAASIMPLVEPIKDSFLETSFGLNLSLFKRLSHLLRDLRYGVWAAILLGFGRAMAEVGAVMMVGGNIRFKTRVLTTAIVLETNQGNFEFALLMGLTLLGLSFTINFVVHAMVKGLTYDRV